MKFGKNLLAHAMDPQEALIDLAILQQSRAVHQARAAAVQRKQSWLAMQKKRKALELLVERGQQAELLQQLKLEQKNADEYASQLYSRARAENV